MQGAAQIIQGGVELVAFLIAYWLAAVSLLVYVLLGPEKQARLDAVFGVYSQVCWIILAPPAPPSFMHCVITEPSTGRSYSRMW